MYFIDPDGMLALPPSNLNGTSALNKTVWTDSDGTWIRATGEWVSLTQGVDNIIDTVTISGTATNNKSQISSAPLLLTLAEGTLSGIAADAAIIEPSDFVPQKWIGEAILGGVALAVIGYYALNNDSNEDDSTYAPDEPLRRNEDGTPKADEEAEGSEHTQLGTREGRKGSYKQGREFDKDGNPVIDIDHTDHGRPSQHPPGKHKHRWIPNKTGGTPSRGGAEPLN